MNSQGQTGCLEVDCDNTPATCKAGCGRHKRKDDIVRRLEIKAGVMEIGERIQWGSDTALMREAAVYIDLLERKLDLLEQDYRIISGAARDAVLALSLRNAVEDASEKAEQYLHAAFQQVTK